MLADVCKVLEIGNPRNAAARLDDDEKGIHKVDTLGGTQEMTVVSESGLYSTVMASRKPEVVFCKVVEIGNPTMAAGRLDDEEKSTLSSIEGSKINGLTKGAALPTIINEAGLYSLVMTSRKPDADVCKVLEIGNPRNAAARLDDDEKGVHNVDTPGGTQEMTVVSESGLYSTVLTSRKPEAKVFKRWVTGTVLPILRKTGTYTVPAALPAPELPTIDLTDSALVLAIITAQATKAIAEGKRAVTDTLRCRRLG